MLEVEVGSYEQGNRGSLVNSSPQSAKQYLRRQGSATWSDKGSDKLSDKGSLKKFIGKMKGESPKVKTVQQIKQLQPTLSPRYEENDGGEEGDTFKDKEQPDVNVSKDYNHDQDVEHESNRLNESGHKEQSFSFIKLDKQDEFQVYQNGSKPVALQGLRTPEARIQRPGSSEMHAMSVKSNKSQEKTEDPPQNNQDSPDLSKQTSKQFYSSKNGSVKSKQQVYSPRNGSSEYFEAAEFTPTKSNTPSENSPFEKPQHPLKQPQQQSFRPDTQQEQQLPQHISQQEFYQSQPQQPYLDPQMSRSFEYYDSRQPPPPGPYPQDMYRPNSPHGMRQYPGRPPYEGMVRAPCYSPGPQPYPDYHPPYPHYNQHHPYHPYPPYEPQYDEYPPAPPPPAPYTPPYYNRAPSPLNGLSSAKYSPPMQQRHTIGKAGPQPERFEEKGRRQSANSGADLLRSVRMAAQNSLDLVTSEVMNSKRSAQQLEREPETGTNQRQRSTGIPSNKDSKPEKQGEESEIVPLERQKSGEKYEVGQGLKREVSMQSDSTNTMKSTSQIQTNGPFTQASLQRVNSISSNYSSQSRHTSQIPKPQASQRTASQLITQKELGKENVQQQVNGSSVYEPSTPSLKLRENGFTTPQSPSTDRQSVKQNSLNSNQNQNGSTLNGNTAPSTPGVLNQNYNPALDTQNSQQYRPETPLQVRSQRHILSQLESQENELLDSNSNINFNYGNGLFSSNYHPRNGINLSKSKSISEKEKLYKSQTEKHMDQQMQFIQKQHERIKELQKNNVQASKDVNYLMNTIHAMAKIMEQRDNQTELIQSEYQEILKLCNKWERKGVKVGLFGSSTKKEIVDKLPQVRDQIETFKSVRDGELSKQIILQIEDAKKICSNYTVKRAT